MSTIRAAGLMFRMTPFIEPTRWSLVPKSVVSVMMGSAKDGLHFKRCSRKTDRARRVLLLLQPIGHKVACQDSVSEWLRRGGSAGVSPAPWRCFKPKFAGKMPALPSLLDRFNCERYSEMRA